MTETIAVAGGPGGVTVALDEIRLLASALEVVADTLRPAGDPLTLAASDVAMAPLGLAGGVDWDVVTVKAAVVRASAALDDTLKTRDGLVQAIVDLRDRLRAAARFYQEAERQAAQEFSDGAKARADLLRAWLIPQQAALGIFGFVATASTFAVAMLFEASTSDQGLAGAVRLHHVSLRSIALGLPLWATPSTTEVARWYYSLAQGLHGDGLTVEVTAGERRAGQALSGVQDLIALIDQAGVSETEARISVSQVTAADGHVSWVVAIPGTRSLSLGSGSDPMDMSTNLRAVGGDTTAVGLAVVAALDQAGVKANEEVLLVGHSQGGLVAAALAANLDFTTAYNVAGVVTAGSPIACIPVRPHVKVLSLEHTQDVVPALDGAANPDTINQVTVTRDLSKSSDPAQAKRAKDLAAAHSTETYAATAAMVDTSGRLSIQAWRQAAAPMLDPAAKVETQFFDMRRVDQPASKAPDKGATMLAPAAPGLPYYESGGTPVHRV